MLINVSNLEIIFQISYSQSERERRSILVNTLGWEAPGTVQNYFDSVD